MKWYFYKLWGFATQISRELLHLMFEEREIIPERLTPFVK